jgi:hypothetical protein
MRDPRQVDGYMYVAYKAQSLSPIRRCHTNSTPVVEGSSIR